MCLLPGYRKNDDFLELIPLLVLKVQHHVVRIVRVNLKNLTVVMKQVLRGAIGALRAKWGNG